MKSKALHHSSQTTIHFTSFSYFLWVVCFVCCSLWFHGFAREVCHACTTVGCTKFRHQDWHVQKLECVKCLKSFVLLTAKCEIQSKCLLLVFSKSGLIQLYTSCWKAQKSILFQDIQRKFLIELLVKICQRGFCIEMFFLSYFNPYIVFLSLAMSYFVFCYGTKTLFNPQNTTIVIQQKIFFYHSSKFWRSQIKKWHWVTWLSRKHWTEKLAPLATE